jgi:3-hydroxybutyryl-CoA dehydratase
LRFKRPVRIGDTVTVRVGVSAIEPRTGVITMSTACVVNGKTVLDGEALVMVPRQKAA